MANTRRWTMEWYRTTPGESPIQQFLASLQGRNKDEAAALLKLVREWGNRLRTPRSEALGEGCSSFAATRSGCSTYSGPASGS